LRAWSQARLCTKQPTTSTGQVALILVISYRHRRDKNNIPNPTLGFPPRRDPGESPFNASAREDLRESASSPPSASSATPARALTAYHLVFRCCLPAAAQNSHIRTKASSGACLRRHVLSMPDVQAHCKSLALGARARPATPLCRLHAVIGPCRWLEGQPAGPTPKPK